MSELNDKTNNSMTKWYDTFNHPQMLLTLLSQATNKFDY